jgi:transcriptional/translational regulatory protein YebC/TACO1
VIRVDGENEELLLTALDAGAEDVSQEDGETAIYTEAKELAKVREGLLAAGVEIQDFGLEFVPNATVPVADDSTEEKLFKLLDALDDLDDVVNVSHNAETS